MDDDECGAIGVMISRGNRFTRGKPVSVPLCPPQIPHNLTQAGTRAAVLESARATARACSNLRRNSNFKLKNMLSRLWSDRRRCLD
jgi:hypothetical protein